MDSPKPSRPNSPHDDQSQLPLSASVSSPDLTLPASLLFRPGYPRAPSNAEVDTEHHSPPLSRAGEHPREDTPLARGLGITNLKPKHRQAVSRVPVANKSHSRKSSSTSLLQLPTSTQLDDTNEDDFQDVQRQNTNPSIGSSLHQPYQLIASTEHLTKTADFAERPLDSKGPGTNLQCKSTRNIHQGRRHWLSITVIVLAIYSTVFSAIWLIVAAVRPRYGQTISTVSGGRLTPGNASLISTALAKSIELSFVTVFVAFLGQVLSRRALALQSRGISIAEMSLRTLVMQPGTMITHWENVRYAGTTFLGVLALTATILAMFYTTASDALVSPKLRFGKSEPYTLAGRVATQFANPEYIANACRTPISKQDKDNAGSTCIAIEHAGQAYHNYVQYLGAWKDNISSGTGTKDLSTRPPPVAMLFDNTTVHGSWIHIENMTTTSNRYGRIVNNVTMAMPHAGIVAAARDPINDILQPQDLNGLGEFKIEASVPSPAINVLCVGMTQKELEPLVYQSWPRQAKVAFNASTWLNGHDVPAYPDWLNKTVVDDIFGFGEKYNRRPPIFPKYPLPYNTLLNTTINYVDALYILATSPTSDYMLCSISASLTPDCSTGYNSSMSGGHVRSYCGSAHNKLAYSNSNSDATNGLRNYDFTNVAYSWATAISLGDGIADGNASNARLLTQLIPTSNSLDESLPSIAEALAVLSGCTLLISTIDAPFIHYWNYSTTIPTLSSPQYQRFNATLAFQDYASYGNQPWQNIFFLVLILVFVLNLLCLVYLFMYGGLVTDFIEPQNLFALSLNSPPSQYLGGSCGGGPEGEKLGARWWITLENDHVSIGDRGREPISVPSSSRLEDLEYYDSPISKSYSRLSAHKTSIL